MSSFSRPNLKTFKAGGVVRKGRAVKFGADSEHVVECTAATDATIGLAQSDAVAAEEFVEVALPGGGALAKAQATFSKGQLLVPHTDGAIKKAAAAGNRLVGVAMDDAVAGDLVGIEVIAGHAQAAEA